MMGAVLVCSDPGFVKNDPTTTTFFFSYWQHIVKAMNSGKALLLAAPASPLNIGHVM